MWTGRFFTIGQFDFNALFLGFGLSGEQGREAIEDGAQGDFPLKPLLLDLLRGDRASKKDGQGGSDPSRGF